MRRNHFPHNAALRVDPWQFLWWYTSPNLFDFLCHNCGKFYVQI